MMNHTAMLSLYQLKPAFQRLLRPAVRTVVALGLRANGVTVLAAAGSVLLGALLLLKASAHPRLFLLLPPWLLLRMMLNAMDGMMAREFGQQSALGAYLNELGDVVADIALALPFALIPPFGWPSMGAVIILGMLSEMSGVLAPMVGQPRNYSGPMGKSDRALVFGLLGLYLGLYAQLPPAAFWLPPALCLAMLVNIVRRVVAGIAPTRSTQA